jgi:hypothetical protein
MRTKKEKKTEDEKKEEMKRKIQGFVTPHYLHRINSCLTEYETSRGVITAADGDRSRHAVGDRGEPLWGPDIARTSHIGSVTSFIHSKVHFYKQIQPNLTCNTPQNYHQCEVFH